MILDHVQIILAQLKIMRDSCTFEDFEISVQIVAIEYETKELLKLIEVEHEDSLPNDLDDTVEWVQPPVD